ncbi:MAG: hypothetical protein WCT20_04290 [Candidatus Babeliales bacterium]
MFFRKHLACVFLLVTSSLLNAAFKSSSLEQTDRRFLNLVLTNQAAALNKIDTENDAAIQHMKDLDIEKKAPIEQCELFREFVQKQESVCPVILLGECTKEDFWDCRLSRTYQPFYRNCFEENVVTALLGKLTAIDTRQIEYVGFGVGGCFQDFVIVAKTLAQKPNAPLSIHLIDRNFTPYVKWRDELNSGRCIDRDYFSDFIAQKPRLLGYGRKEWADENISDTQLEQRLFGECTRIEVQALQFIGFLKKMFPQSHLQLYLHESSESYLDYINRHQMTPADLITAADIQDEMSLLRRSMRDYLLLCEKTLQQNPLSLNFLLDKHPEDEKAEACLTKICLEEKPGCKKFNTGNDPAFTIPLYWSNLPINPSWLKCIIL